MVRRLRIAWDLSISSFQGLYGAHRLLCGNYMPTERILERWEFDSTCSAAGDGLVTCDQVDI